MASPPPSSDVSSKPEPALAQVTKAIWDWGSWGVTKVGNLAKQAMPTLPPAEKEEGQEGTHAIDAVKEGGKEEKREGEAKGTVEEAAAKEIAGVAPQDELGTVLRKEASTSVDATVAAADAITDTGVDVKAEADTGDGKSANGDAAPVGDDREDGTDSETVMNVPEFKEGGEGSSMSNNEAAEAAETAPAADEECNRPPAPAQQTGTDQLEGTEACAVEERYNPLLCVMRHSVRLDVSLMEQDDSAAAAAAAAAAIKSVDDAWPDQAARGYDTPVCDLDMPAVSAVEMEHHGFKVILSSPFRRCLQTAGVVARGLGIEGVTIHKGLGERMDKVRQDGGLSAADAEKFTYLCEEDMQLALGNGVKVIQVIGDAPPFSETAMDAKMRIIKELQQVSTSAQQGPGQDCPFGEGNILVVAHGDTLGALAEAFANSIIFEADYCSWAVVDVQDRAVLDFRGVQMIPC